MAHNYAEKTRNDMEITKLNADDKDEFYGQLIDVFEDFLEAHGITKEDLKNPDREDIEDAAAAIIYGEDYDELREGLSAVIENWFDVKP